MRKRLTIIICLLFIAITSFFGCGKDPYANMKIEVVEGLTFANIVDNQIVDVQQLNISEIWKDGELVYEYDRIDFTVKVTGVDDDVDQRVIVSGWNGYIDEPTLEYLGNGLTRITSKPISAEYNTRKFTLRIQSTEGKAYLNVTFNIDLKINSFEFNSNVLEAVTSDYELVLSNIQEDLISYEPALTSQRSLTYSIAIPTLGMESGEYIIADRVGNTSVIYHVDEDFATYMEAGYKYADVITNPITGKQTLKIYPYFMTSEGRYALDEDGDKIPAIYPQILKGVSGSMEPILYDCVTIRAHSNSGNSKVADQFLDIEVVPSAGEVVLAMNSQASVDDVMINKDSFGRFNIVMIDPDYKGGLLTNDEMTYYTERNLTFFVKNPMAESTGISYLSEYEVTSENVTPDASNSNSGPTDILKIGGESGVFNISALKAGTYTHTFILQHKTYKELFTQEVQVVFKVLAIPFKINVNGNTISSVENNNYINTIYNTYPSNTYGTKFNIDTRSDFKYFVFYKSDIESSISDSLMIRREGDGSEVVFACVESGDGKVLISSSKEGQEYTRFGAQNDFYLKHSMDILPSSQVTIYIGILFSMADSSYDSELVDDYFISTMLSYPIHLVFENGLTDIDFEQSSYKINLNNSNYQYELNSFGEVVDYESGLKLWELPAGRTVANSIKSITYDKNLIKVYSVRDLETDITTLYVKYTDPTAVGKTKISIESFNGLSDYVWVENYIPTIYEYNGEQLSNPLMPLAVEVDKYSSGYLYSMTGKDAENHEAQYDLYSTTSDVGSIDVYNSVKTLFMIVNAEQNIKFLDYRVMLVDGYLKAVPFDITSKVKVTFNYNNYVTYSNGKLTTNSLVTLDLNKPIKMTVTYTSGYEGFDEEGKSIYVPYTMTHKIDVYIYEPLEGVEVTSAKAVDLYIDNSLGYYNKDLSRHTIISTYIPNEIKLGAQWNESELWGLKGEESDPVKLTYVYDVLESVIIDSSGKEMKIYSNNSSNYRIIYYKDLFEVSVDEEKYECYVHNVVSNDLYTWFNSNGYTSTELIDFALKKIFAENIEFVVNVYINQFNKLQNINSVRFKAKYANRIAELKLDVEDDGVCFEIRKNAQGEIISSADKIVINYTIDSADVVNKNIALSNNNKPHYSVEIVPNATGNGGKIYITPTMSSAGIENLILSPEDNIKTIENGEFIYYNPSSLLVQSFRIKVADGSSQYPFEIKNVSDYMQMLDDVKNGNYYHYVISRDLNMNGFDIANIDINNIQGQNSKFYLSGKHSYSRNGQQITNYNTIYNLEITSIVNELSKDVNIGLFANLDGCVVLDNISIESAVVTVYDNTKKNNYNINVGILAGNVSDATITSCSVSGIIKLIRNQDIMTSNFIVGGMFGNTQNTTIYGQPGGYEDGIVSTGNNSYVDIELTLGNGISPDSSLASTNIIGGLVGFAQDTSIDSVQVISNITTVMRSTIGGLVGIVSGGSDVIASSIINNAYILPSIVANVNTVAGENEGLVIGGAIGSTQNEQYQLSNTIVNFINLGDDVYAWQYRTNLYVIAPSEKVAIAGLIGKENIQASIFEYNYVRSYYENESSERYKGNLYVVANNGSVGGLIGENITSSTMKYSYFDGDITASEGLNIGMLIGTINYSNYSIEYSYSIGNMSSLSSTLESNEVSNVSGNCGIFGGISFGNQLSGNEKFGDNVAYLAETPSLRAINIYAVINGFINYFVENSTVYGIECKNASDNPITITEKLGISTSQIPYLMANGLGYSIALGDNPLSGEQWFWNAGINTITIKNTTNAYPVLLKNGKVLFDLVPNSIGVIINDRDGLYSINYNGETQVIMYLNQLTSGANDKTYYEISRNDDSSAFVVTLEGTIIETLYVKINALTMNDRVEFLESSNGSVINIVGNKIYPVSTGVVELTIRSFVSKSIYITLKILVVDGITDYSVMANNSVLVPVTTLVNGEEMVEYSRVYIDETTNYALEAINKNANYFANSKYGFIMEILDTGDNGTIKINNIEYTYNSTDFSKNIIRFDARNFNITGVDFGKVRIIITPYLVLDQLVTTNNPIVFVDTYESKVTTSNTVTFENIYLLDNEIGSYANLQKTYAIEVIAKAKSIENSKTELAIVSSNTVSFITTLETANIKFVQEGEDGSELYYITILENLYININNKYSSTIYFKDVRFYYTNGKLVWDSAQISSLLNCEIDYTLINILFDGMSIVKTNIDPVTRINTYKISLNGVVTFDREYYRTHADEYDLNTVLFNVNFIPESNNELSSNMAISIVTTSIDEIFTNFYTSISKTLDGDINENVDGESTFIVPEREGLLKLTLNNEFNNSSYITLSVNKQYAQFVNIQQVAAVFDPNTFNDEGDVIVGDILTYRDIITIESFEDNTQSGIRLLKLSLNYNDINYFNNTYYVRVLVSKSINLSALDFEISSYTVEDNVASKQFTKDYSLQIMELPEVRVTINDDNYSVIGKGVRKEISVYSKGLSENILFNITETSNLLETNNKTINEVIYITDDLGNIVFEQLDLDYLRSGRKYYINQDVTTPEGCEFAIRFSASETILGVIEESECYLYIDTVNFEIDNIKLCGVDDVLHLKFGENMRVETVITPKAIVVGNKSDIDEFKLQLEELIKMAQYEFAGIRVTKLLDGQEQIITKGDINLKYRDEEYGVIIYKDIIKGTFKGITIERESSVMNDLIYQYYEIIGSEISSDTYIRLDVDYYYNNGILTAGADSIYVYNKTIDIQVVVEDNSTYDHPTPIEDQNKLLSICSVSEGNFILINNITLQNWKPQEVNFDSLDGNGYTITIESFDLSDYRGVNKANVGLFSVVNKNTLLKNITVDISPLLKTEINLFNDIEQMKASSKDTYNYKNDNIDLGYITELNFGIIAGTNHGAITNAKVISTYDTNITGNERDYLHILTTQGFDNDKFIVSNIGGLVGINEESGAISNSFIGVNASNYEQIVTEDNKVITNYYIQGVANPSKTSMENKSDDLEKIQVYPFVLAGGNNLGGLVSTNKGVVSNSYAKGLGVFNTFPYVGDAATAGLVTYNEGVITSTFVEGNEIEGYRAVDNIYRIESTAYIGGLVYENSKTIENSYANVYSETFSSLIGGFVFINNEGATINNCYSTAVVRNSQAKGQFTGVEDGIVQNFGTYTNCYYLVDGQNGEFANADEYAIAINNNSVEFDDASSWNGFAFVTGVNEDGIWTISDVSAPKLVSSQTDTVSFRRLIDSQTDMETNSVTFNYMYDTYYLGTKENPLIIDKAENFDTYIIDSSYNIGGKYIFGHRETESATRYVRIVNNLDFTSITTAKEHKGTYLYKVTFAGVLDGNGMSLQNLNISTDSTELENFGIFAQVGYENATAEKAVVKNLNLLVSSYKSNANKRAGILAGTIVNSSIVNVKINGGAQTVSGLNMSGALAGLIYTTNGLSATLIDITVENVKIEASHTSLGGNITERSEDMSNYFFDSFSIEIDGQQSNSGYSFDTLYNDGSTNLFGTNSKINKISYAGGVAGVILANNYSKEIDMDSSLITQYRTLQNESSIDNIISKGEVIISDADNAGGLFGYIGENTIVKNSKLIVSDSQLLKANNNIGGIVGENHGIIEQCTVAYDETKQAEYDATILSNDRGNGTFNLFEMSSGEPYYTVSIGGIAGYSENGVIIDSYSKVNVVKSLSYIAGGIIGYSNGYNYLGYVYNTGAVLGKYITGGIIGIQVNDGRKTDDGTKIDNKVYMENIVSLTNWNASSQTLNIRDHITKILYDDTKFMYKDSEGYNNFYIKMPEVGNSLVNYVDDLVNSEKQETYRKSHSVYYVGSVVGKSMINIGNGNIENGSTNDKYHTYANHALLDLLYSEKNVSGVFSSTLGLISTEGQSNQHSRVDSYTKISFEVDGGEDNKIISLSYRPAYSISPNNYEPITSATSEDSYLDKHSYSQIFTTQEYIQQLLGDSYSKEDGKDTYRSTLNIFISGINLDCEEETDMRYQTGSVGSFTDVNANIWDVSQYLPYYSKGVTTSVEIVTNSDQLNKAFNNSTIGKTYKIQVVDNNLDGDYTNDIVLDCNSTGNKYIQYYGGIKSLFVGENHENGTKPTITINLTDNNGVETKLATIFNMFTGAVFQNLSIIFNVSKTNFVNANIDTEDYGLLANTLDGVQIIDCEFKINVENEVKYNCPTFNAINVGILFGNVSSSSITNSIFEITTKNGIILENAKIENFGLFAGSVSRTTFTNCKFKLGDSLVTINNSSDNLSLGGLVGHIYNSKFNVLRQSVTEDYNNITVKDYYESPTSIKSVGSLFGYAYQLNLLAIKPFNDDLNSTNISNISDLYVSLSNMNFTANENIKELNIANIAGKSTASRIGDVILDSNTSIKVKGSATIDSLNIGSIIGYDVESSQIGKSGVVGSYSSINSTLSAIELAVGGIVGKCGISGQLINNVFTDNNINITNNNIIDIEKMEKDSDGNDVIKHYYATTYVGGILGYAYLSVGISDVVSASDIVVNINENKTNTVDDLVRVAVGGIVGASRNVLTINNFTSIGQLSLNKYDYDFNRYETYMSGVLGFNDGIFRASNGYSYVELPRDTSVELPRDTSVKTYLYAITNGVIDNISNVYYAQEFVGNQYESDARFVSYAMGDLYGNAVSQYSNIYELTQLGMSTIQMGNITLIIPKSLKVSDDLGQYINRTANNSGLSKFDLYDISSDSETIKDYNVISSELTLSESLEKDVDNGISATTIVSGRSTEIGKTEVIIINEDNSTKYLTEINNGIISNIYLKAGNENQSTNVALVKRNNGLITNVMIHGISGVNYAIAYENYGKIYSSVASVKYLPSDPDQNTFYGLVVVNETTGEISDCYSSSFGYTESKTYTTNVFGFADTNKGFISNSLYYVPSSMGYDNIRSGYVETFEGVINNCYNNELPSTLLTRNSIWTQENYHAQIKGMKDILGDIVTKIIIDVYDNNEIVEDLSGEISSVYDLKNKIDESIINSYTYKLSYSYKFYVNSEDMPSYKVLRVSQASELITYVNSLTNGYIPKNTIILITNNLLNSNGKTSIINVDATLLQRISLNEGSAIIGINALYDSESTEQNADYINNFITLDFSVSENVAGLMEHELINVNNGLITGITIANLEIKKIKAVEYFAPIMENSGTMDNFNFSNVTVKGISSTYVAGLVKLNSDKGIINNCQLFGMNIYCLHWVNKVCTINLGRINNVDFSGIQSGNEYSGGV